MRPTITINDRTQAVPGQQKAAIAYVVEQAVTDWTNQIAPGRGLDVVVHLDGRLGEAIGQEITRSRVIIGPRDGKTLAASTAGYKLAFGHDGNGAQPDIVLELNAALIPWMQLDGGIAPTAYQFDLYSTVSHEIGHALFMFSGPKVPAGNGASLWDMHREATATGRVFAGPNTVKLAGGPLPLMPFGEPHLTETAAETFGSTLGPYAEKGEHFRLVRLDIALASDCGLPTELDDTIYAGPYSGALDGRAGRDTVIIDDEAASFAFSRRDDDWVVTHATEHYSIAFRNVEVLQFTDSAFFLFG